MYLEPGSVETNFQTMQEYSGTGSRVIFDCIHASVLRHANTLYGEEGLLESVAKEGEPWRFGLEPEEISSFLNRFSFEVGDCKGASELERSYFINRKGRLVGRINGTHFIVAAYLAARESYFGY